MLLLLCGVLSSVLYVLTDVLGGMQYEGYSFTSQVVNELLANRAPSNAIVDPVFMMYGVLVFAFGVGVYRASAGRKTALRTCAMLLIAYAIACLPGPFVPMARRGAGDAASDLPQILLTVLLLLLPAIGFGAFALGRRFRVYSLATLVIIVAMGALSVRYGICIAKQQPTPGFGIIERITIYSSLLWIAVLGVNLMHSRKAAAARWRPLDDQRFFRLGSMTTSRVRDRSARDRTDNVDSLTDA